MSPWVAVSLSGHALLMLPLAAALGAAMWFGGARREAGWWFGLLAAALGVTVVTKVAFFGWGIGVAALDFAGFSGHATNAAAIYPVLAAILLQRRPAWARRAAIVAAVGWSMMVAMSRLRLEQHTVSEVVAGLVLGWLVSSAFLHLARRPLPLSWRQPAWIAASCAGLLLAAKLAGLPLRPHYLVIDTALALSGNARPYSRERAWRECLPAARTPASAPIVRERARDDGAGGCGSGWGC